MSSLGKHLTTPGPHGGLSFHSQCPICCQARLHGAISVAPVVPPKVKASLATVLVTASAGVTPAMSLAQDADEEVEGIELPRAPEHRGPDPGDELRVPDDQSVPVPVSPGGDENDDAGGPALESEPEIDPVQPEEPPPAATAPLPATAPEQAPSTPPEPAHPAPVTGDEPKRVNRDSNGGEDAPSTPTKEGRAPASKMAPGVPLPAAAPPAPAQARTPSAAPRELTRKEPNTVAGQHVVQPGESLWSIAAGLAGDDASPARIARIVNRLWALNADRIGTGDPDLVMAGTTLRLR